MENNKKLIIDCDEHKIGSEKCDRCWISYPKKCDCGGLIHASFGDEMEVETA